MFTVSRRVINELVELTCAINFSLLFSFLVSGAKSRAASAFMVGGERQHYGNVAFN